MRKAVLFRTCHSAQQRTSRDSSTALPILMLCPRQKFHLPPCTHRVGYGAQSLRKSPRWIEQYVQWNRICRGYKKKSLVWHMMSLLIFCPSLSAGPLATFEWYYRQMTDSSSYPRGIRFQSNYCSLWGNCLQNSIHATLSTISGDLEIMMLETMSLVFLSMVFMSARRRH